MLTDKVETTREEVLSMVAALPDYGSHAMVESFLWELLGKTISEEEIEEYSKALLDDPIYEQEDYEEVKRRLTEFKQIFEGARFVRTSTVENPA